MFLRFLGGLVLLVGCGLGWMGEKRAYAQADCGIAGYIWHPCHADFVPVRQVLAGGVQQMVYRYSDGTVAVYRAIPHSAMANYPLPLKTMIEQARDTFMKDWKATPKEMWAKTPEGIDTFVMFFPGQRFVSIVPVSAGFLIGAFQIPSQTSPLFLHLKQEKLSPRAHPPQIKHIKLLYPMKKPVAPQGSGSRQPSASGASWRCNSMGTYKSCQKSTGSVWERNCMTRTSSAFGFGDTRYAAEVQANISCSGHMTRMIIISNMGGGGYTVSTCRAVSCQRLR